MSALCQEPILRALNLGPGATAILTVTNTYDTIITLYPGRDVYRQASSDRRGASSKLRPVIGCSQKDGGDNEQNGKA